MYDLSETTFITFVKLDNEARIKNLRAMVNFYRKHCENTHHILIEEDTHPKLPDHIDIDNNTTYIFTKNNGEWRKCEGYNRGIKLANTQYLIFNDVDVIVNPPQILETIEKLKSPKSGLLYPFNGLFLCVTDKVKDEFTNTLDYNDLDKHFPSMVDDYDGINVEPAYAHVNKTDGEVLIGHINSTGGCVMGRRDVMIKCNGYNPNFVGWGYEDDEVPWRITKLGYPAGRITGSKKPAWHLPHFDGTGSRKETQPNHTSNQQLYFNIREMSVEQLTEHTRSWRL